MSDSLTAASTILLLRDRAPEVAGYEVFMVRRHGKSGFMAGAFVFPGGKLDDADADDAVLARCAGLTGSEAAQALGEPELSESQALAMYVAAVRETFEEAGVLFADVGSRGDVAAARQALHEGASWGSVLSDLDATLQLDALVPFARWITPEQEKRRFDTRFFVARSPEGQQAEHDQRETTEAAWLAPDESLEAMNKGEINLPPPTARNLHWIADHRDTEEVLRACRDRKPPLVRPIIAQPEGKVTIVLPGDELHPEDHPVMEGPTRVVLEQGRWWVK